MKMFKKILPLIGLVMCFSALGQQSLLWKIERSDFKQPSYLFGTMHLICETEYVMPEKVKHHLQQANVLVLEANPKKANAIKVLKKSFAPADSVLAKLLTDTAFAEVDQYFRLLTGRSVAAYQRFKPFFISSLAALYYMNCKPKEMISIEKELIKLKPRKTKIVELEGFDQQMLLVDQIDLKQQALMLLDFARNHNNNYAEMQGLVSAYLAEDLDQLIRLSENTLKSDASAAFERLFLESRNKNWIPIISKLTKDKGAFIAVGAAHLGGESGLIALLRYQGFTVTPVMQSHNN